MSFDVDIYEAGSKKRGDLYVCSGHAKVGMVGLNGVQKCALQGCSTRCAQPSCGKGPSFGAEGTKKVEFCAGHARDGMVDLKSTKCAQRGCTKIPSLGVPGTRQREFCRENARDGMVDLINRNSAHRGCAKAAPRSVSGTKRRESCREHAKDGMVNVRDAVVLGPETALDRDILQQQCHHMPVLQLKSEEAAPAPAPLTSTEQDCREEASLGLRTSPPLTTTVQRAEADFVG